MALLQAKRVVHFLEVGKRNEKKQTKVATVIQQIVQLRIDHLDHLDNLKNWQILWSSMAHVASVRFTGISPHSRLHSGNSKMEAAFTKVFSASPERVRLFKDGATRNSIKLFGGFLYTQNVCTQRYSKARHSIRWPGLLRPPTGGTGGVAHIPGQLLP